MPVDDPTTVVLCHYDGADESTTITDETGRSWTAYDGAKLDDAQKKFGATALYLDGVNDYAATADAAALQLGLTFTIDFWFYAAANTSANFRGVIDKWATNDGYAIYFPTAGSGIIGTLLGDATIFSTTQICNSVWHHVAVCGDGTNARLFIDGTQEGSTTSIAGKSIVASGHLLYLSGDAVSTLKNGMAIRIDELHIMKGKALYTTNFTPPPTPYGLFLPRIIMF